MCLYCATEEEEAGSAVISRSIFQKQVETLENIGLVPLNSRFSTVQVPRSNISMQSFTSQFPCPLHRSYMHPLFMPKVLQYLAILLAQIELKTKKTKIISCYFMKQSTRVTPTRIKIYSSLLVVLLELLPALLLEGNFECVSYLYYDALCMSQCYLHWETWTTIILSLLSELALQYFHYSIVRL